MTASLDPGRLLADILTERGPLHDDDLVEQLQAVGVADPTRVLRQLRLGIDFPARQLIDGRWVWLPAVLAGRVFTCRAGEPEVGFDLLTVTPDLEPIAVHRIDAKDAIGLNMLLWLYDRMAVRHLHESAPAADVTEPKVRASGRVVDDIGRALADPAIVELLALETAQDGRASAVGLRLLAEALAPKVAASARVACQWLGAVACERDGDIDGFERALLDARAMDGDWPLTLLDLARIASDRGDAEAGLMLLRRAGATADHPLVYLLRLHRPEKRTALGRNTACWCGSGRKYKKCHLGRTELSLPDRVAWLYHKAIQHVMFGGWTDLRYAVALERCRHDIADDDDAFNAALADPLAIDTILFEGGGFEEFLTVRGALLPEDEQRLAEQWLPVERSVFEIEHVDRDGSITVRDARTGERHEVDERTAGHPLRPGQLVCARVVPDGAGMRFFGLEPISEQQRDPLIALLNTGPHPVELVAQLSGGDRPRATRRIA